MCAVCAMMLAACVCLCVFNWLNYVCAHTGMPKPDGLGTYMSLSNRFADYGLPPVTLALEQRARRQGGRGGGGS